MYSTPPMIAEISITTPKEGKILGNIVPRQENKTLKYWAVHEQSFYFKRRYFVLIF